MKNVFLNFILQEISGSFLKRQIPQEDLVNAALKGTMRENAYINCGYSLIRGPN